MLETGEATRWGCQLSLSTNSQHVKPETPNKACLAMAALCLGFAHASGYRHPGTR